ncbi:MAG: hypothetical protein HY540_06075 [Deltaproteobacteria bacterium]|nr:hypothetical protein [Deltaproteobacteria bacterium]
MSLQMSGLTTTSNTTPSISKDGYPNSPETAKQGPWGMESAYHKGSDAPLVILGSIAAAPCFLTGPWGLAACTALIAACSNDFEPLADPEDPTLCHDLPDISADNAAELTPELTAYLTALLSRLPKGACEKIRHIKFVDSLETEETPFHPSTQLNFMFSRIGLQHLSLGYALNGPEDAARYSEKDATLFIKQRYNGSFNSSERRQVAYDMLVGIGLAMRTQEIVDHLYDGLLTPGEKAFVNTDKTKRQIAREFPSSFAHYVLSGHTLRALFQHEDDDADAFPEDMSLALAYLPRFELAYQWMKQNIFGDHEYMTEDVYPRLAEADIETIKAKAAGQDIHFDSAALEPYRNVFEATPSPGQMDAFLFATNRLLESFPPAQPPHPKHLAVVNRYVHVAQHNVDRRNDIGTAISEGIFVLSRNPVDETAWQLWEGVIKYLGDPNYGLKKNECAGGGFSGSLDFALMSLASNLTYSGQSIPPRAKLLCDSISPHALCQSVWDENAVTAHDCRHSGRD